VGLPLDTEAIDAFVNQYGNEISCIAFMGGDAEPTSVNRLAQYIHEEHPQFKVAWYSGRIRIPRGVVRADFDYIKLGPFIKHLGPLKQTTTNQRLYRKDDNGVFEDITSRFWRTSVDQ
jgi:anaerobic ribonucleoside-triphosphate reductase activating protein